MKVNELVNHVSSCVYDTQVAQPIGTCLYVDIYDRCMIVV